MLKRSLVLILAALGLLSPSSAQSQGVGRPAFPVSANVKDFGALCDGSTDDTAAIQAAINSAFYNIYIPEGHCAIYGRLTLKPVLYLHGAGPASTIYNFGNDHALYDASDAFIHIENLEIADQISGTRTSGNAINIGNANGAIVENVIISGHETGIALNQLLNTQVRGNRVSSPLLDGFSFTGSSTSSKIESNYASMASAGRYCYYVSGWAYSSLDNNACDNNTNVGYYITGSSSVTLESDGAENLTLTGTAIVVNLSTNIFILNARMGNTTQTTSTDALDIQGSTNVFVMGGAFYKFGGYGVNITTSGATVSKNVWLAGTQWATMGLGTYSDLTGAITTYEDPNVTTGIYVNGGALTETWTVGTGGVTANTLVQPDTSAPSKIIDGTTGAYGIAMTTVAAAGTVQVARYGTVLCVTDTGGSTAGDLVIQGSRTSHDCKDSGQTSSSGISSAVRIVGAFRSSVAAGAQALVELLPGHFGTLVPIGTNVSGLGTGVATFLATPSGANFASALTSGLPNSALANAATTVNGQTCTLGSTCTVPTSHVIAFHFDGGGSALSGTTVRCERAPVTSTINGWYIDADQSGSATFGVRSVAFASYTGSAGYSGYTDVTGGGTAPVLSSAVTATFAKLTSWVTSVTAGAEYCVQLSSPSTITWANLYIGLH